MTQILELPDGEFKITMINIFGALMEKVKKKKFKNRECKQRGRNSKKNSEKNAGDPKHCDRNKQ